MNERTPYWFTVHFDTGTYRGSNRVSATTRREAIAQGVPEGATPGRIIRHRPVEEGDELVLTDPAEIVQDKLPEGYTLKEMFRDYETICFEVYFGSRYSGLLTGTMDGERWATGWNASFSARDPRMVKDDPIALIHDLVRASRLY